jgi:calcineurin-like phosphoesterase family protein
MYFFTADEHYGHDKEFLWGFRGFNNIEEHDNELIRRHNACTTKNDITIHAGDFALHGNKREVIQIKYIKRLNGNHIFLKGSHDRWLKGWQASHIWQKQIDGQFVVVCHYAMRTWHRSHYNSWQLYGHSHGRLEPIGKQWDIGVDNNDFFPVSWDEVIQIMKFRPNNPNLVKR